jgi:hypothetical protein
MLMPEILELLQRHKQAQTKLIHTSMLPVAARNGLRYRPQATGYSLTVLKWKGWAANDKRGVWAITLKGERVKLTRDEAIAIGKQWDSK